MCIRDRLYLVDMVHDLKNFRTFLDARVEQKNDLNKQKQELAAEYKRLEQSKIDYITEYNKNVNQEEKDALAKELEELNEKLLNATRTESRWIKDRIRKVEAKQSEFDWEIEKFDKDLVK